MAKDGLLIKPIPRIETVIGRPILLVAVLGAQQAADGVTAKANQVGQEMAAASVERSLVAESGAGVLDEGVQIF